jgi:uncharacterized integral membrane protein
MQMFFLAALAFALVAVLFALQNIVPVRVAFLTWTFEGSLAVVLFVALIVGALVSALVSVPSIVKGRWIVKTLRKQIAELETARDASTPQVRHRAASTVAGDVGVPPLEYERKSS